MKKGLISELALLLLIALALFYLYQDTGLPQRGRKLLQESPHRAGLGPENPAAQLPLPAHPLGKKGTAGEAPATPADGVQAALAWVRFLEQRLGLVGAEVVLWHNRIYIAVPEQRQVNPQRIIAAVKAQEPAWQEVIVLTQPGERARLQKIAAAIRQGRTAADFTAELELLARGGGR